MTADRIRRLALTVTATICALALIATFNNPVAFVVALFGTTWVASVVVAVVMWTRAKETAAVCDELARVAKTAAAEVLQLDQENMRLHLELAEAQLLAGTARVPVLRVVRPGSES